MKKDFNFENLYIYEGNKIAYLAAQKIVEFPGELFNPFYLYSGTGLGKTHLLKAIYNELKKKTTVTFLTIQEFEDYLNRNEEFNDALIVDDIHNLSNKYQKELLNCIDSLLTSGKQLCVSASLSPKNIENFSNRLLSRLEGGLVCEIQPPKEIALIGLIKKKASERGIILPDDVALELTQISTGSIREIEGMINRLVAYSSLGNLTLDINSIRFVLKEFYPKGIYSPVSSLLEELKKNASEVLQDVTEGAGEKEEYKQKIYIWEMKGFDVLALKLLLEGDISVLRREYNNFIQEIEQLIELQKEYGTLQTDNYPEEALQIESMLFSPDKLKEIKQLIAKIQSGVKAVKPTKTFKDFIIGTSNETAFRIYQEEILEGKFNPFIVIGKKGTGKTHFLAAIYHDLKSKNKNVVFFDTKEGEIPASLNTDEIDVLILDNFHNLTEKDRKPGLEIVSDFIKKDKKVIISLGVSPQDLSLSKQERIPFEFAIEVEIDSPGNDIVKEYLKMRTDAIEYQEIVKKGIPEFSSFYEIDDFLQSQKIKPEILTPKEVSLKALPQNGQAQQLTETQPKEEIIPLGLPGETPVEIQPAVQLTEAQPKEEIQETIQVEKPKKVILGKVNETRLIYPEILNELLEENY